MDENKRIVICRRCKKPEYWGEMRWLSWILRHANVVSLQSAMGK